MWAGAEEKVWQPFIVCLRHSFVITSVFPCQQTLTDCLTVVSRPAETGYPFRFFLFLPNRLYPYLNTFSWEKTTLCRWMKGLRIQFPIITPSMAACSLHHAAIAETHVLHFLIQSLMTPLWFIDQFLGSPNNIIHYISVGENIWFLNLAWDNGLEKEKKIGWI